MIHKSKKKLNIIHTKVNKNSKMANHLWRIFFLLSTFVLLASSLELYERVHCVHMYWVKKELRKVKQVLQEHNRLLESFFW